MMISFKKDDPVEHVPDICLSATADRAACIMTSEAPASVERIDLRLPPNHGFADPQPPNKTIRSDGSRTNVDSTDGIGVLADQHAKPAHTDPFRWIEVDPPIPSVATDDGGLHAMSPTLRTALFTFPLRGHSLSDA